jgi:hypothetical protein
VAFYLEQIVSKTKEEVITAMRECAAALGRVPTIPELRQMMKLSERDIRANFGTYKALLKVCGLERQGAGYALSPKALFLSWAKVARELGKIPTQGEYHLTSKHCGQPFTRRYGSWRSVPAGMMEYARKEGVEGDWEDVLKLITVFLQEEPERDRISTSDNMALSWPTMLTDEPIYGEPLSHPSVSYAPTNESGVIFLFGTVAEKLGFMIQRVQTGFPDCEAIRRIEPGRWQRVRIEFEYESRNFLAHMHPATKCDLIVCWRHNWKDCPLDVLELCQVVRSQLEESRNPTQDPLP